MSDVTRASTEGLTASGRIAVILKHMGPYQYTAGPDYTALPIERTEFLETVLPRYAGGFEAGAHGVMMSFVALNGVPAHADPYPARPRQGGRRPGRHHRVRLRRHLRALRRLRLRREPQGGRAPRPSPRAASTSTSARFSSSSTCPTSSRRAASPSRTCASAPPRCCS